MKKQLTNSPAPAFARAARSTTRRIFAPRFLALAAAGFAWLPATQGVILAVPAPDNPVTDDCFGSSVGISGTTAIVEAFGKDSGKGAAYLYTGITGTPTETKLTASDNPAELGV